MTARRSLVLALGLALLATRAAAQEGVGVLDSTVAAWFARPPAERKDGDLAPAAAVYSELVAAGRSDAARRAVVLGYRSGEAGRTARKDARAVAAGELAMPFTLERRGRRPERGYPVFIALHGGGGVPREVNDQQWEVMQRYYRATDCIYVAPRAPTDAWNGFYTEYVYPLVGELLRHLNVFEEIDPDRVYLLGYSHGGYGAFSIGMKMADRFAAIHADAAAPTDGDSAPENLRNTAFSCLVGERDADFGRRARCEAFALAVTKLRGDATDTYPVTVEVAPGKHHPDLGDHDRPALLSGVRRTPAPRTLRWRPTDPVVKDFAWLSLSAPARGQELSASVDGNRVEVTASGFEAPAPDVQPPPACVLRVRLDARLVDARRPVTVVVNGRVAFEGALAPDLATLCRTLAERGDPGLAFDREVAVTLGPGEGRQSPRK